MSKIDKDKKFTIAFTLEDILDVRLLIKAGKLSGFVLSYRAKISGMWHEVFRVDTCHGYLHMQKFWESPETIKLKEYKDMPLEMVFQEFLQRLKDNWQRYRRYMEKVVKNGQD